MQFLAGWRHRRVVGRTNHETGGSDRARQRSDVFTRRLLTELPRLFGSHFRAWCVLALSSFIVGCRTGAGQAVLSEAPAEVWRDAALGSRDSKGGKILADRTNAEGQDPVVAYVNRSPVLASDFLKFIASARWPGYHPSTEGEAVRLLRTFLVERAVGEPVGSEVRSWSEVKIRNALFPYDVQIARDEVLALVIAGQGPRSGPPSPPGVAFQ